MPKRVWSEMLLQEYIFKVYLIHLGHPVLIFFCLIIFILLVSDRTSRLQTTYIRIEKVERPLIPISEFVLDEKFQQNASKFVILYIGI